MKVNVLKRFPYAFHGTETMDLMPGEVHDLDPAHVPGLQAIGLVSPVEGEPASPADTQPRTVAAPEMGGDDVDQAPKAANEDGTSKAQQPYVHVTNKLATEEAQKAKAAREAEEAKHAKSKKAEEAKLAEEHAKARK